MITNYISRAEADELCDELIRQFMGEDDHDLCVDIDCFVGGFLGCPVVYENFAEDDPDKIGFASDGVQPLRVRMNGRIQDQVYPRRTIVLDRVLLNPGEEYRRRFTLAHEAGHIIASRIDPNIRSGFHRVHDECRMYTAEELRQRLSIAEWQANVIAAALLMPRFIIKDALVRFNGGRRLPVYGSNIFAVREKVILQKMAKSLGVSHTALIIRLRDLDALKYHDLSEFINKELRPGGVIA